MQDTHGTKADGTPITDAMAEAMADVSVSEVIRRAIGEYLRASGGAPVPGESTDLGVTSCRDHADP